MSDPVLYTKAEEISDVTAKRPHLVLLGAGASRAACPNGDREGQPLPVMADFIELLNLKDLLADHGIESAGANFEALYSELCADPKRRALREELECTISRYFRGLRLPDGPTIYDYLVLSLREKDAVATFNWDPFLWQACARNRHVAPLPKIFFLHGCAFIGLCERHKRQGPLGAVCAVCSVPYEPLPLLYPVAVKDYTSGFYISSQWRSVRAGLGQAFLLTIFGYGAPATDVEAVSLLQDAWGSPDQRTLEEIEIIDRPGSNEEEIRARWGGFIHSHHYQITGDYFDSILAMHPRRSVEAYTESLTNARFREGNSVPKTDSLKELQDWFRHLTAAEQQHEAG